MVVLRIQSPEGTKRVDLGDGETTFNLFEKAFQSFGLECYAFRLYRDRNHTQEISSSKSRPLSEYGLGHGDMIYMSRDGTALTESPPPSAVDTSKVDEDEVDRLLYKTDGKIPRKRDEKLCRHNSNGKCVHCSPLEPYDEGHLREHNVKHLSFHSYLRKLTSGADRGKFLALEDISCKIKAGCKDHPPWPRGICSKCQPSAVTLNRQTYRHVDNVMFENSHVVERFLEYWRSTAHQRIGFLYGRYELHPDVPLGIRARVAAVYEPPQDCTRDSVVLLPDPREEIVGSVARKLDLVRVGWIFTDLLSEDVSKGTVRRIRGVDSHFLTAQECITAGHFQNCHPNACKYASSGHFGSKFVTVCVTGDSSERVHTEGYQVTGQCMALVRDDCLLPTKDAPELGYVRESSDKQYVPDVYYKETDRYNNHVARTARPLPVEYLLVDVPCSTPRVPLATFRHPEPPLRAFPVENRPHEPQDLAALGAHLAQWPHSRFADALGDFHALLYVATMDAFPMLPHMDDLLEAVRTDDRDAVRRWRSSDHWATVEQLIDAAHPSGHPPPDDWTCPHCTFDNAAHRDACEMCVLPRRI